MALCVASTAACSHLPHFLQFWHRSEANAPVTSAAAATATATATATRAQPTTPPNVRFLQQGYLLGVDRGQWVYCRREIPTGSRLPRNSCVPEEKLLQAEADTRDILDAARRMPPTMSPCGFQGCGGGGGGGGGGGSGGDGGRR